MHIYAHELHQPELWSVHIAYNKTISNMSIASKLMLITCFCIHFTVVSNNNWIPNVMDSHIPIFWNICKGVSFLLYPLCGWLADIYVTNYRMIVISFILTVLSSIPVILYATSMILFPSIFLKAVYINYIFFGVAILIGLIALGMYEANAIQFGMDQMLEASSEQLSSFIHWYYWCVHVGPLITYYVLLGILHHYMTCVEDGVHVIAAIKVFGFLLLFPSTGLFVLSLGSFITSLLTKKDLFIDKTQRNHLKLILQVLKYSYKHKYPEKRSAFTYWENYLPSRINLGKHKYGGPFTTEEVEDVKALLRLLLLMMSLFGFQLAGDGNSLTGYIMSTVGCPPLWSMLTVYMNTDHIPLLVVVLGLPLYQLFIKRHFERYIPCLLNIIGTGLFLCFLAQVCYPLISIYTMLTGEFSNSNLNCTDVKKVFFQPPVELVCLAANSRILQNGTCNYVCEDHLMSKVSLMLPVIPLVCYGLSYHMVFMTVLEFICAQAPKHMVGLLIGVWYSLVSIKIAAVSNLDTYTYLLENTKLWNIYHGVKGFCMFLSIAVFWFVSKHYHYRQRDEIVNEQAIIEDQYERELLHNDSDDSSLDAVREEYQRIYSS